MNAYASFRNWGLAAALLGCLTLLPTAAAQTPSAQDSSAPGAQSSPGNGGTVTVPPDYVIGTDDVLTIVFWREKDLSAEVVVRPDGKVSLPLLNEVPAAGLTPEQLRLEVTEAAAQLIEEPTVTVIVKQINSRKVFITGQIAKPGPYPLGAPTTVLQLISMAGGVLDFADSKNISIVRVEKGQPVSYRFNYNDVSRGKKLEQNILLKPNDTIVVPD